MEIIGNDQLEYPNCTTKFISALVRLTYEELAQVLLRGGNRMFDSAVQEAIKEHLLGVLNLSNRFTFAVCHCTPVAGTELRTWQVEGIIVQNFTDLSFS